MICKNLNCMLHFFKIMLSMMNAFNYDEQLLIISFIVSLYRYYLLQIKCNNSSVRLFFLNENVRYCKL